MKLLFADVARELYGGKNINNSSNNSSSNLILSNNSFRSKIKEKFYTTFAEDDLISTSSSASGYDNGDSIHSSPMPNTITSPLPPLSPGNRSYPQLKSPHGKSFSRGIASPNSNNIKLRQHTGFPANYDENSLEKLPFVVPKPKNSNTNNIDPSTRMNFVMDVSSPSSPKHFDTKHSFQMKLASPKPPLSEALKKTISNSFADLNESVVSSSPKNGIRKNTRSNPENEKSTGNIIILPEMKKKDSSLLKLVHMKLKNGGPRPSSPNTFSNSRPSSPNVSKSPSSSPTSNQQNPYTVQSPLPQITGDSSSVVAQKKFMNILAGHLMQILNHERQKLKIEVSNYTNEFNKRHSTQNDKIDYDQFCNEVENLFNFRFGSQDDSYEIKDDKTLEKIFLRSFQEKDTFLFIERIEYDSNEEDTANYKQPNVAHMNLDKPHKFHSIHARMLQLENSLRFLASRRCN